MARDWTLEYFGIADDENVANNIANANSQDLTEQLKNGELEASKFYYFKFPSGMIDIGTKYYLTDFLECKDGDKMKVLAEVPSYEEWQKMKGQRDACAWALDKIGDVLVTHKLVTKIDNTIGEKK